MKDAIDVVVTDYGAVRLSWATLNWLESTEPEWRELLTNKRRRGVRAQAARRLVADLETAVKVAAAIEWSRGGVLSEF